MSLSLALAPFDWKASDGETYKINLIDTPGYADFVGDVDAALSVADLAVSWSARSTASRSAPSRRGASASPPASRGWCSSTRRTSRAPTSTACWTQLRDAFGSGFVPLELPLGEEERLHGIADVLTDQGFEYEPDGTHHDRAAAARRRRRGAPRCTTR